MLKLTEEVNLAGFTFILPSVAVGNVGQLTVDILISTLGLTRIGYVWDPAFIPIVGPDPYDENSTEICTAVDLFCGKELKIVVLQIRSPLIKKPDEFFEEILAFVAKQKIAKVVILTSSYAHEMRDVQIRTVPMRYIASPSIASEFGKLFDDLNWIQLEPKVVDYRDTGGTLEIPGGGFAKSLYETLKRNNVSCAVLLKFCSEGDNVSDAEALTNYLNQWMDLIPKNGSGELRIQHPPSWKLLFGNPPPQEIY